MSSLMASILRFLLAAAGMHFGLRFVFALALGALALPLRIALVADVGSSGFSCGSAVISTTAIESGGLAVG